MPFDSSFNEICDLTMYDNTFIVYVLDGKCEYCPDRALSAALCDWKVELNQPLQAGKD